MESKHQFRFNFIRSKIDSAEKLPVTDVPLRGASRPQGDGDQRTYRFAIKILMSSLVKRGFIPILKIHQTTS